MALPRFDSPFGGAQFPLHQGVFMTVVKDTTLKHTDAIVALETPQPEEWYKHLRRLGVDEHFEIHGNVLAVKQRTPGLAHRMLIPIKSEANCALPVTRYVLVRLDAEDPIIKQASMARQSFFLDVVPRIVQPLPLFRPQNYGQACISTTGLRSLYLAPELKSLKIETADYVFHDLDEADLKFLQRAQISMLPYTLCKFDWKFKVSGEGVDAPWSQDTLTAQVSVIPNGDKVCPRVRTVLSLDSQRVLRVELQLFGSREHSNFFFYSDKDFGPTLLCANPFKNLHYVACPLYNPKLELPVNERVMRAPEFCQEETIFWFPHREKDLIREQNL